MIHETFDFFPFNLSSGPDFLGFYFLFAFSALIGVAYLRRAVGVRLDRSHSSPPLPICTGAAANANPYRAQGSSSPIERKRLTVGWIPKPDEYLAIAYLKGGEHSVANTLISAAMAAGWLTCLKENPGTALLYSVMPPEDAGLAMFHARLAAYHKPELTLAEVRNAATLAASSLAAGITRDLGATGMVRSAVTVRNLSLIPWLSGALVLGVGMIRLLRAFELNRPASLLVVEMLFVMVLFVIVASTTSATSTLRTEYLSWLDDSTISLRTDVASGRRRDPSDVGLAVAVGGASALAAAVPLAMIYSAMVPAPIVFASTSTSSGSSSSGSSCGGGGGSSCGGGGGSSCGGGGGCGG